MSVKAMIAIADTKQTYPLTLDDEPKFGDVIKLHVEDAEREFVVVEVDPTGFTSNAPYLYGVYVKPKV